MVKFRFFVHCSGWASGGYENVQYAYTAKEAKGTLAKWNKEKPGSVSLISITEITEEEFVEDFAGCL